MKKLDRCNATYDKNYLQSYNTTIYTVVDKKAYFYYYKSATTCQHISKYIKKTNDELCEYLRAIAKKLKCTYVTLDMTNGFISINEKDSILGYNKWAFSDAMKTNNK